MILGLISSSTSSSEGSFSESSQNVTGSSFRWMRKHAVLSGVMAAVGVTVVVVASRFFLDEALWEGISNSTSERAEDSRESFGPALDLSCSESKEPPFSGPESSVNLSFNASCLHFEETIGAVMCEEGAEKMECDTLQEENFSTEIFGKGSFLGYQKNTQPVEGEEDRAFFVTDDQDSGHQNPFNADTDEGGQNTSSGQAGEKEPFKGSSSENHYMKPPQKKKPSSEESSQDVQKDIWNLYTFAVKKALKWINPDATLQDLVEHGKAAYKKGLRDKRLEFHPDKCKGEDCVKNFMKTQKAGEILEKSLSLLEKIKV